MAALLVVMAAALTWVGCGRGRAPAALPDSFVSASAEVSSPDMALTLDTARGVVHDGYTDFGLSLACAEPAGCHAALVLTVVLEPGDYRTVLAGTIDGENGATAWFSRPLRPPPAVTAVRRIEIRVKRRFAPGAAAAAERDEF